MNYSAYNVAWADPTNLIYPGANKKWIPLGFYSRNAVRIFKTFQSATIAEMVAELGDEYDVTPVADAECIEGYKPDPRKVTFMAQAAMRWVGNQQLGSSQVFVEATIAKQLADTDSDKFIESTEYQELLIRIFDGACRFDSRIFGWRGQLTGESDLDYARFLSSISRPATRAYKSLDSTEILARKFPRCAVAQVTVEFQSPIFKQ